MNVTINKMNECESVDLASIECNPNECFNNASRIVVKNGGTFCLGKINNGMTDHAWVKIDGKFFDTTLETHLPDLETDHLLVKELTQDELMSAICKLGCRVPTLKDLETIL